MGTGQAQFSEEAKGAGFNLVEKLSAEFHSVTKLRAGFNL